MFLHWTLTLSNIGWNCWTCTGLYITIFSAIFFSAWIHSKPSPIIMINMNDTLTLFWSQIVNIPCKICNSLNSHFHLPLLCYLRLVASPLHNISFPYIIRISMRICYRKYIDKFKTLYFFISIISLERSRSKKKKKKKGED